MHTLAEDTTKEMTTFSPNDVLYSSLYIIGQLASPLGREFLGASESFVSSCFWLLLVSL